jgi:hypothetical protein
MISSQSWSRTETSNGARTLKLSSSPGLSLQFTILPLLPVVLFIFWQSSDATPFVSLNHQRALLFIPSFFLRKALHSILGDTPAGFHVTFIRDRHFRFSVSTKHVGFAVTKLKRIISDQFDVYFHLWRDGGANWFREWSKWQQEEDASWQQVSRRHWKPKKLKHVSFAKNLVQDSPIKKSVPQETILFGDFAGRLDSQLSSSQMQEVQNSNLKNQ